METIKKYSIAAAVAAVFLACAFNIEWFRVAAARAGRHAPNALKFAALAAAAATYFSFRGKTGTGAAKNRRCQSLFPPLFFPSWLKESAAISAAVILFLMPLFQAWISDRDPVLYTGNSIMGAYLQTSDAQSYYFGAQKLARTGNINDWNARRPLNVAWQSLMHTLAGWDIRWFLVMQAALLGLTCWSLARIVGREFGLAAGTAAFMLMLMWGRCLVYTTLSESLGMILGASALALLWTGASARSLRWFLSGLTVLTMALNARAGAFFALPVLALWGGWAFSGKGRFSIKSAGACAAAVALGFLIHTAPPLIYNGELAVGHYNFACVIYGISDGGAGWNKAYLEFPKVNHKDFSRFVYKKSLEKIKSRPSLAAKGLLKYMVKECRHAGGVLAMLFFERPFGRGRAAPLYVFIFFVTAGVLGAGWFRFAFFNIGDNRVKLVLWGTAGMLASLPILADGGWRVLTSTVPLIAVNAGFAFAGLQKVIPSPKNRDRRRQSTALPVPVFRPARYAALPAAISAAVLFACIAGPAVAHHVEMMRHGDHPNFSLGNCRRGEEEIVVDAEKALFLEILPAGSAEKTFKPRVRSEDLIYTTKAFEAMPELLRDREVIENYSGPRTIILALGPKQDIYNIFAPPGAMENRPDWMYFCGNYKKGDATSLHTGLWTVFIASEYGTARGRKGLSTDEHR